VDTSVPTGGAQPTDIGNNTVDDYGSFSDSIRPAGSAQRERLPADQTEQPPKPVEKRKVKVGDEELEVSADEAFKNYQLARASYKKMEEAAKVRKEAEAALTEVRGFIQGLKDPKNLWQLVQQLGHDPRHLSEAHLAEQIRIESLSPEERRLYDREQRIRQQEEEYARREAEWRQKQLEEETPRLREKFEREFKGALKSAGIPDSPRFIARMADLKSEFGDLDANEAAGILAVEAQEEFTERLSTMSDEELFKALGEQRMGRIRQLDLQRLRNPVPQRTPAQAAQRPEQPRKKDWHDWLDDAPRWK